MHTITRSVFRLLLLGCVTSLAVAQTAQTASTASQGGLNVSIATTGELKGQGSETLTQGLPELRMYPLALIDDQEGTVAPGSILGLGADEADPVKKLGDKKEQQISGPDPGTGNANPTPITPVLGGSPPPPAGKCDATSKDKNPNCKPKNSNAVNSSQ